MRSALFLVFVVTVLVLTACSPGEAGRQFAEKNSLDTGLTGNVISDVYNTDHCESDVDCNVGRVCENRTCVPKH